jgi:hypothetical protein
LNITLHLSPKGKATDSEVNPFAGALLPSLVFVQSFLDKEIFKEAEKGRKKIRGHF